MEIALLILSGINNGQLIFLELMKGASPETKEQLAKEQVAFMAFWRRVGDLLLPPGTPLVPPQ